MQNEPHSTFILGDKTFDFVKKLVQVILPACGALYFGLAQIWGLPEAENVVGTIVVFQTFLGVVLGISTAQYNASGKGIDGRLTIESAPPGGTPTVTGLSLPKTAQELESKKSVTLTVETSEPLPVIEAFEDEEDEEPPMNPATSRKPTRVAKKKPSK